MRWLVVIVLVAACAEDRPRPDGGDAGARVHPAGILDPASEAFHGKELARRNWSFTTCARCHGEDFAGGAAKVSCLTCHADGPTACTTCHGDGPTTGAHALHRTGATCVDCHRVPASWDAPGHIVDDAAPAEVTFGARASITLDPAHRAGPPAYEGGRCTNVYCHGDVLPFPTATSEPRWDDTPVGGCNRCHGAPPPDHAQDHCATCHPTSAPHIDGVIQVGSTSGCSGCHGDASSPAPPNDLDGNRLTTALGVGAHRAHLDVPTGLRGPIACATCHLVPATVGAPGHIDSMLPAEVTAGLGWDRAAQTCASAWCHQASRPRWTEAGVVACGTCHGVPPADASHSPSMPLTQCASCHPRTMTPAGTLILTPGPNGPTSEHIDGDVDLL
ncbi:MAG: CxxxxCH/CxxCH domain-containing protein [Kofleriaceae bacterium]|nr:CxxxxCH/CxxCH domain-containing protein [Kofleriaceae bacterium]